VDRRRLAVHFGADPTVLEVREFPAAVAGGEQPDERFTLDHGQ
jgi:hypothetical protein